MRNAYLKPLENLPYFDIPILTGLFPGAPLTSLRHYLSNWVKTGKIYRLTNGRYVAKSAYLKYSSDPRYPEYLASTFSYPSYLSCEYILSKFGFLTEGTFPLTSVTLKEKKSVTNILGTFLYHQISPALYLGFTSRFFITHEYFEASPAKALFDFLYYRSHLINNEMISHGLREEFRFNLENFTPENIQELISYAALTNSPKLISICTQLSSS